MAEDAKVEDVPVVAMITEEEDICQMAEGTMVARKTDQDTDRTVDKDGTVIMVDIVVVEGGSTV